MLPLGCLSHAPTKVLQPLKFPKEVVKMPNQINVLRQCPQSGLREDSCTHFHKPTFDHTNLLFYSCSIVFKTEPRLFLIFKNKAWVQPVSRPRTHPSRLSPKCEQQDATFLTTVLQFPFVVPNAFSKNEKYKVGLPSET